MISSHCWGDPGSQKRLQRLGGIVGPISSVATTFVEEWQFARANRDPSRFFGIGFGSDTNGLRSQPPPRPGAAANPVTYPYRSFDGGSLIDRQRSGTRVYDINVDGVDHYGLYPDWIEDLRMVGGAADRRRHGQRRRGVPSDVGACRKRCGALSQWPERVATLAW